jgi:Zn-dependent protease with chaperone function
MPFLLLLFLTLACLEDDWRTWDWLGSPTWSAALTWALLGIWVGLGAFLSRQTRQQLVHGNEAREAIAAHYHTRRFYHTVGLYILYTICLYGLGWGSAVQASLGSETALAPGGELLILAPFLAGLIFSWAFYYDAEKALYEFGRTGGEPYCSRSAYLSLRIRMDLGFVAIPILLLIIQRVALRMLPEVGPAWSGYAAHFVGIGISLALFICLPWILRFVLKLKPLPVGPVRTRLEEVARRLNFRCSEILLWNTRSGMANAMVAGVLPWPRYVLLTDRLLTEMNPDEIDAVFGHEVGHVKHHHMPFYAGFLIASIIVLWMGAALLLPENEFVHKLAAFPLVAILGAYIFLVFGFLSRRCERQADIYGCRAVSCGRADCTGHDPLPERMGRGRLCPTGIKTFISALEKVASLNGISRDRPGFFQSWQHSTIARRVEFLQTLLEDRTLEPRFQRKVFFVKWGLLVGLGAAMVVLLGIQGP